MQPDDELDYYWSYRPFLYSWLTISAAGLAAGFWLYPFWAMALFLFAIFVWTNCYSTVMHYSLDAEEFTHLPRIGIAFVVFQSHHFPKWINEIHRKPIQDLVGELNPLATINLISAIALFRFKGVVVFVVYGALMLVGSYAMLCHRWAHQPEGTRPRLARLLQRAHLALNPDEHWKHHALAAMPNGRFVPNFDLSFGWSNPVFNRLFKLLPNARFWIAVIALATFTQIWLFSTLLQWTRHPR